MPAEVKVLIEGYVDKGIARPTITLIRDSDLVILVDPGIVESPEILIDALQKENLTPEDISIVCITHSHFDHYKNVGIFPNARILEGARFWGGDKFATYPKKLTDNIKILPTPGHDSTSITLFVNTGKEGLFPGIVAICGDVYWKADYPERSYDDPYAENTDKLDESRRFVLENADWVIPGHGNIYKNDKFLAHGVEVPTPILKIKENKLPKCRKCGKDIGANKECRCRPFLCFKCCECEQECGNCSCGHRVFKGGWETD